jgi:hypothetical protein
VWEDGLSAFERTLRRLCMESDTYCVWAEAVQQDFSTQLRASSSMYKWLTGLNRMFEECQILLCL